MPRTTVKPSPTPVYLSRQYNRVGTILLPSLELKEVELTHWRGRRQSSKAGSPTSKL